MKGRKAVMRRAIIITFLLIVGVLYAARAALAPAAWEGVHFASGSNAFMVASAVLAGRNTTPYEFCSNAEQTKLLIHGKSLEPDQKSVALEVMQIGAHWEIHESSAELWGAGPCKPADKLSMGWPKKLG